MWAHVILLLHGPSIRATLAKQRHAAKSKDGLAFLRIGNTALVFEISHSTMYLHKFHHLAEKYSNCEMCLTNSMRFLLLSE